MAMSLSAVPSLSNSNSSDYCPSTKTSSDLLIGHQSLLEDDGTGVLVIPSSVSQIQNNNFVYTYTQPQTQTQAQTQTYNYNYTCLFHILNCHETFTNPEGWKTHVLSHFQGHEPPSTARCPFCLSTFPTTTPHTHVYTRAWDALLAHIDIAHYRHDHALSLANTRPDFELLRYLYNRRIISEEQLKAVQLGPGPGPGPGSGPRSERGSGSGNAGYHHHHHRGIDTRETEEPYWGSFSWRRERRAERGGRERERERERRRMGVV